MNTFNLFMIGLVWSVFCMFVGIGWRRACALTVNTNDWSGFVGWLVSMAMPPVLLALGFVQIALWAVGKYTS